jgi:hypothetical protein
MGGAEHISAYREIRSAHKTSLGKPKKRNPSEDLGVDERIILKWISGK